MSTGDVWGAPGGQPSRWGPRETAAALGVAALIAGVGGAAIYAATDSGRARGGPGSQHAFGPPPAGAAGPGGSAGQAGPPGTVALHGEFVVRDGGGGYTTRVSQTGVVTATTPTTVTVRSADDYTQTWQIPVGAEAAPVGAQISVEGIRSGVTTSANRISPAPR